VRGHASCLLADPVGYRPRRPAQSTLYRVVSTELEGFLARQAEADRPVPEFVENELRAFLECGILAHGFCRVHCAHCRKDKLVPFSCKGRGICSSCSGRRMAETAAHLVDNVVPRVPVRQWVLSLPLQIRYLVAYDSRLLTAVLGVVTRAIRAWYRKAARKKHGVTNTVTGAITAIQRFGSALNLNPHFHSPWADGVWDVSGPSPRFLEVDAPTEEDLEKLVRTVGKRVRRLLVRRGLLDEDGHVLDDPLAGDESALPGASQASIAQRDERGWHLESLGRRDDPITSIETNRKGQSARHEGFSLHASRPIAANDRKSLEHLFRYALRPAIVDDRLDQRPDGKITVKLKTPWRDGTHTIVLTPHQFMQRLVALVPAPRANLVRYHGVFAANSKWRKQIVPHRPVEQLELVDLETGEPKPPQQLDAGKSRAATSVRPDNYDWATLLRRVFEVDVTVCVDCGGPTKIISTITQPDVIEKILKHLGLPTKPPRFEARGPPVDPDDQLQLIWPDDDRVA
jgi:hypothetical protein